MHCDFARDMDVRLRDQLVCGVLNDSIRKRLMENDKCSFADARKRANELERIARYSKVLGGAERSVSSIKQKSGASSTTRAMGNYSEAGSDRLRSDPVAVSSRQVFFDRGKITRLDQR